jgi:deoxyribonuclease-1
MKHEVLIVVLFLLTLTSCTSTAVKQTSQTSLSAARRSIASEMFWFAHPCPNTRGVAFRKYQSFALDADTGHLFGRASDSSEPVEINDKPTGKGNWASVEEFLEVKGISQACPKGDVEVAGNKAPVPSQKQGRLGRPKKSEKDFTLKGDDQFVAPVTEDQAAYYEPVQDFLRNPHDADPQFKADLAKVLSRNHLQSLGRGDQLVEQCPAKQDAVICVHQKPFTYEGARREMFGNVALGDLRQTARGDYEVFDYYCQGWRDKDEIAKLSNDPEGFPGPGHIVSVKVMNTEHTWPQSKFPSPKGSQGNLIEKTDLHHIFPTDTKVNADRGNHEFAEVKHETAAAMKCSDGYLGEPVLVAGATARAGEKYFEPPTGHKGDVARALFYFSTRYNAGMSSLQEAYLRKWHQEDPPDEREIKRNEALYHLMGVRNPYIDHPEWVQKVTRFCRFRAGSETMSENSCP